MSTLYQPKHPRHSTMHSVMLKRLSSSFYCTIPASSLRQQHSDWSKEHFQVVAEKQRGVWLSIASRVALSLVHVSSGAGLRSHFVPRWASISSHTAAGSHDAGLHHISRR